MTNEAAKYPWAAKNRWMQLGDTVCITARHPDGTCSKLYGALHGLTCNGSVSLWFDEALPVAGCRLKTTTVDWSDVTNIQPADGEVHRLDVI